MNNQIFSLKDKNVIITGGLGQLGQIFAETTIKNKGRAIIFDVLEKEDFKKIFSLKNIDYFKVDITKKDEIQNATDEILKKYKKVDILINNAGLDSPPNAPYEEVGPFENYPENSFDNVMNVNVKGVFLCCQVVGDIMSKNNKGVIINISSIYGMLSPRQEIYNFRNGEKVFNKPISYSVSKSAVLNLTRYLSTYWSSKNIRVNTLTLSGVFNNQPPEFINEYIKHVPLKRMLNPEEVVGPYLFLASDASSYMTGSNLIIDGGWSAW